MIRLRFSRGVGLAGAIVRAVTWCDFAHVGFLLPGGQVLDATPRAGVTTRAVEDDETTRYYSIEAPAGLSFQAVAWAWGQIGQPYDWSGALGVGIHRDWHKPGRWDCAELVWAAFKAAGLELIRTDHLDRVTPRDLLMSPYLIPPPVSAGGGRGALTPRAARGYLA